MAFDFLGTFNKSQFDRFIAYARLQLADIGRRVTHLNMEISRVGSLTMSYEAGGVPKSYNVSSSTQTYIGALVAAYEALGGNVPYDLQVRSLDQAVVLMAGSEQDAPQYFSNGEVVPGKAQLDAVSANHIRAARYWMQGTLHYKREYLERKVRRSLDYIDQLRAEKTYLSKITGDATSKGSLEFLANSIQKLLTSTEYTAIYDDGGGDPYGKYVYAPTLPYSRTDNTLDSDEPGSSGKDAGGFIPAGVDGVLSDNSSDGNSEGSA